MAILRQVIDIARAFENAGARRSAHAPAGFLWRRCRWRIGVVLAVVCLASNFLRLPAHGGAQAANEYQVKAAFLFNFAKFVEWPAESLSGDSPFTVGIIGDDPFGGVIDQAMNGKVINGRQIQLKRIKWGQNLRECHILFISSSEKKKIAQIVDTLRGASTLTVGECDAFAQQGGMINFIMEDNRVRFEINTAYAEQAGLKISSKLLTLAKTVRNGQGGRG